MVVAVLMIGLSVPDGSFAQSPTGGAFPGSPPTPSTASVDLGPYDRPASTIPAGRGGGLAVQAGTGGAARPPRADPGTAEPGPKREIPTGDFSNSPTTFDRGQVSPVRGARLPWESSGSINADGSPQVISKKAEAWLSKPGVELVRKLRKDESAELGLSLFGCKDDGSADAARGVVSTARACSGAEKATLARLTADPGAPGSLGTSVEVPSLRGPASKVFVNPDGTKTVRLFQNTVHSRAANGEWVDANPTVRLDPNGGKGLIADGVDGITRFSAVTGDGPLVGFEPSGPGADRLAFGLEGAAAGVKAEVRGQSVLYRDVFAGVDVQVDQQPLSAKGSVILKRGGTPSVFRFPLDAATGSTARVEGRNVIVSNSKGVQVGVFATPAVFVPGSSMAAAGGSANPCSSDRFGFDGEGRDRKSGSLDDRCLGGCDVAGSARAKVPGGDRSDVVDQTVARWRRRRDGVRELRFVAWTQQSAGLSFVL